MSGFFDQVANYIKGCGIGTSAKRRAVVEAAGKIDEQPDSMASNLLKMGFISWLSQGKWLLDEHVDHGLPATVNRSDAEVAREYRLGTDSGIKRKQEELYEAAQTRIQRATEHIEAGWDPRDVRCFVASVEEYDAAKRKAGIPDFPA